MSDRERAMCRYYENVPCLLGPLAPYCHMMCELNEEAKQYMREMNLLAKEEGSCKNAEHEHV